MIGFLLLSVFVLVMTLLFIPLTFCVQGRLAETIFGQIEVAWAGGLIATHWPQEKVNKTRSGWRSGDGDRPSSGLRTESPEIKPTQDAKKPRKYGWSFIKPFLNQTVFKEGLLFIRQLWKSLKLRFNLSGEYGTEDPALTGMIAALISALDLGNGNFRIRSNFECNTLDLQGELRGRIIPALLMWQCGRFILRPPIRRIWWPILTTRIIRKEGGV
jgi:hypothetical protein